MRKRIPFLSRNTRKTGSVSSAPPECQREFLAVWRRAAAPFALLLLAGSFLEAQSSTPVPAVPGSDPASIMKLQMELFRESVQNNNDQAARRASATTRQEQIARLQFMAKANHFVALWSDFVHRLNDQQTFDSKLAKKISKAFRELEKSDGWPLREGEK